MRPRKKTNLAPRLAACAPVVIQSPEEKKGRIREQFPSPAAPLHLELGCGKGAFICELASLHPEINFVAMEKEANVAVIATERAMEARLPNLRFILGDAGRLSEIFLPGEVGRIYINFCDPWPKTNQKKRRLTHGNFLQLYRRVLPMGGEIHFKSDNDKLFEWSLEEIPQFGFRLSQVTRDLHADGPVGVMTDYEAKFYQQGVTINRCVATMVPWEAPAQPEESEEA